MADEKKDKGLVEFKIPVTFHAEIHPTSAESNRADKGDYKIAVEEVKAYSFTEPDELDDKPNPAKGITRWSLRFVGRVESILGGSAEVVNVGRQCSWFHRIPVGLSAPAGLSKEDAAVWDRREKFNEGNTKKLLIVGGKDPEKVKTGKVNLGAGTFKGMHLAIRYVPGEQGAPGSAGQDDCTYLNADEEVKAVEGTLTERKRPVRARGGDAGTNGKGAAGMRDGAKRVGQVEDAAPAGGSESDDESTVDFGEL